MESEDVPELPKLVHGDPILFGTSHVCLLLVGGTGCGKSELAYTLTPRIAFDRLFLVTKNNTPNPAHTRLRKLCEANDREFYTVRDPEAYLKVTRALISEKVASPWSPSLTIFDDYCTGPEATGFDQDCDLAILESVSDYRGAGFSHLILTQSIQKLLTKSRTNLSGIIIFRTPSAASRRCYLQDFTGVESSPEMAEVIKQILSHANRTPYTYLFHILEGVPCVGCGYSGSATPLIKMGELCVPNPQEILDQCHAENAEEMRSVGDAVQRGLGNCARNENIE